MLLSSHWIANTFIIRESATCFNFSLALMDLWIYELERERGNTMYVRPSKQQQQQVAIFEEERDCYYNSFALNRFVWLNL